jgi:hypothetical protein
VNSSRRCSKWRRHNRWRVPPHTSGRSATVGRHLPRITRTRPPSQHQDRGNGAEPAASTSKSRLGPNHDARDTIEARRRAVASKTTAPEIDTITATNTVRTDTTTRDADDTTTVMTTATVAGNRSREACEPSS